MGRRTIYALRNIVDFGTGFLRGYAMVRDLNRRDELAAREKEKYEFEKRERQRKEQYELGLKNIVDKYTTEPLLTEDAAGNITQVGTRQKKPDLRGALGMIEEVNAYNVAHGKFSPEGYAAALERAKKMREEGVFEAYQVLLQTGDPRRAVEQYNRVGEDRIKLDDTLRAVEVEHPLFGRYTKLVGQHESGAPAELDMFKAAAAVGGAKGFLDRAEKEARLRILRDEADTRSRESARRAEADAARDDRENRRIDILERIASRGSAAGAPKQTALQRNVEYLVANGVAKDAADAFGKLRTAMGKSEDDAILAVARDLARSPRFMGKGGPERAVEEATRMVRALRTERESEGGGFNSAEEVRSAFRAGRIDRARAIKELGNFGFAPE
jgi:hypothetical protein